VSEASSAPRPALRGLHHVEIWVPDLDVAVPAWGWLFDELDWEIFQNWENGRSWRCGEMYVVVERSPALTADTHDRCRPGLNHLAFHAGNRADVDRLTEAAPHQGWALMFADRHPHAGGPDHYAAFLENVDGYEIELVPS
jgi:catechol 2,3-dioxygenase-like lactoylglutathione lyase family enzyme